MGKLSLFIACSIDGYIAKENDDLTFLKTVEKEGEDYGYAKFVQGIDTYLIGRKTYDYVAREIGPDYYIKNEKEVYVATRTPREREGNLIFYSGHLPELVYNLKAQGRNIYCDGGGQVIKTLLEHHLIDEMIISTVPVTLGNGVRLFQAGFPEAKWNLHEVKAYDTGLVQVRWGLDRF
ncbi:dihydrofolate reductase family protein [Leadbetterella byssophila]|uniref:dihydrofolate reductase family protein n=1 Tax=Leadbetterella byssophila TaxID=316068 RepID=UPI0039A38A06